jgi:2-methylisocitrate lyase-like PEP mutase family enzyme
MAMIPIAARAERFRELHRGSAPLILPNAWDVPSARVFEDAGFLAVATSSAGLMVSLGYPDGETLPRRTLVSAVERIASRLAVPLSADLVAGYGRHPRAVAASVAAVVGAGAVGINLEDVDPTHHRLRPVGRQVETLRAVVGARESTGVPFVVNARTDAYRYAEGDEDVRLRETIERLTAYRDAGADCVYPMGVVEAGAIETVVNALDCPVNVMVRRGLPPVAELARLGVKRVSFGPYASYAALGLLKRAAEEVRQKGTYELLVEGAIGHDELNRLAVARERPAPG